VAGSTAAIGGGANPTQCSADTAFVDSFG